MTDTTEDLLLSGDVINRIQHGLTYATLHRWVRHGAITPTKPPAGKGSEIGWTHHDTKKLAAIAHVRADLTTLGLPCPWPLVAKLWTDLTQWGEADINADTITITVHLNPED